ncbi:hypothetical protein BGZ67_004787 [Mortierella alpina]|nr:hypothetical protein BGZ67_004787 [Mortierella alpina]
MAVIFVLFLLYGDRGPECRSAIIIQSRIFIIPVASWCRLSSRYNININGTTSTTATITAANNAPLNEWTVPGAAAGLGDPMTGDLIATAALAHNTDNNHNHNHQSNYNSDSRQDGRFCYFNSGSSNHSSNSNSNSSMNGSRSIIQQTFYDHRQQQQQQQTSPAYVDGSVHGCSDDELQRSIEFYERVLEQQKFQLSMQRQIRLQTELQQPAPPPPQQQQQQQLFQSDICLQQL